MQQPFNAQFTMFVYLRGRSLLCDYFGIDEPACAANDDGWADRAERMDR